VGWAWRTRGFLLALGERHVSARTTAHRGRRRPLARSAREAAREAVVEALRSRAREPSPDVRQAVASVLGEIGGAAALAELAPLLADRSDRVRRAAVLALGHASGSTPREHARIRRFLRDPAPRVRAAAAVVLGRRRDRASVPALLARLRAPGTWEKPSVAVALGRIGDRRAVGELVVLAAHPARWLRVCALHALGEIGAPEGRPSVRAGLADPAWSVRGAAATALGTVGTPRDAPRLLELADDPHPWPRRGAIYALGRMHWREAAGRIRAALDDPAPEVRVAACWALGELGDRSSRRPLARILSICPLPATSEVPAAPPPVRGLPGASAEGLLFETAVAALARLGAVRPDLEVDRALANAEKRLRPDALERTMHQVFPGSGPSGPPPTLRQLFDAARSAPGPGGSRR